VFFEHKNLYPHFFFSSFFSFSLFHPTTKMFSKSAQRVSTTTSRMTKRFTSNKTGSEGATAASRGSFGDKEKAVENQWARSHVSNRLCMCVKEPFY
jgi:hypothetical protein